MASSNLGMTRLGLALFAVNVVAYPVLWLLTVTRLVWHPRRALADLVDHTRGCGYYTTIAGTCVLGTQCVLLVGLYRVAAILWAIALVLWVTLTYTIFTALTIREHKPSLAEGINGAWLLAVVSTQAVALLGAQLASSFGPYRLITETFALSMWLWGGMLYIWMISSICYRYTFFAFAPGDLTPPYWINMGATAISSLTGAVLVRNTADAPFLHAMLPFLKGFTMFYWATGTWWLPMLVILAIWRHGYRGFPLRYDPLYWGAVFPLGMYAACTLEIARALELPFLARIPETFVFVALAAWAAAFLGLLRRLRRVVVGPGSAERV